MKMNLGASLIIVLCGSICAREPECSNFYYVEKTLEKMINTEIYVKKMKSDIDAREQNMKEMLDKVEEEWKTATSDLVAVKEKYEESINEYKKEIDKVRDESPAPVNRVPVIAFQAHELQTLSPSPSDTLIFTVTDFDEGSGYNNKSGVYTTPVNGVYLFTCQLCIHPKTYSYVQLVSGGTSVVRMFMDGGNTNSACRKMTGISILKANEQVWIQVWSTSGGTVLWRNVGSQNIFSGVLINTF